MNVDGSGFPCLEPRILLLFVSSSGVEVVNAFQDTVSTLYLLSPQIGLLATVGVWQAAVIPSPRVGVMSTGDELVEPNEPIKGGCIRDSNR